MADQRSIVHEAEATSRVLRAVEEGAPTAAWLAASISGHCDSLNHVKHCRDDDKLVSEPQAD